MSETSEKARILIVDDSKVIRRAAGKMLGQDYDVCEAADGIDAWAMIQQDTAISVIFSDMQMPGMDGIELLDTIRGSEEERISNLPVIMITGYGDTDTAKKEVFDHGATDFISKPFDSIDLLSRAQSYARLTRKVVELEKQTGTDKLTGLMNATSFEQHCSKMLSFTQRHGLSISMVQLEIDDFQNLFLIHGKTVAQQIIVAVADKLVETLRAEDIAARTSVARYTLLLSLTNLPHARIVVDRIRETVNDLVIDTGKERIRIALVAGITAHDNTTGLSYADLVGQADQALAEAAARSGVKVASFITEQDYEIPTVVTEQDLRRAFDKALSGNFQQIPVDHLQELVHRLKPLLDYADAPGKLYLTASGDGH